VNIERILYFIFKNNILIIELLFAISLLGVLLLALRFFTSNEDHSGSTPDWSKLENNIKKILENASVAGAGKAPVVSAHLGEPLEIPEGMSESVFIQELQTQLERAQIQLLQKDEEIKKLNNEGNVNAGLPAQQPVENATPSGGTDVTVFEEKIKDLESRLNEYSIIEDDIADLSFYKEETVRLQSEVDKLTAELAALKEAEAKAPKVDPIPLVMNPTPVEVPVVPTPPIAIIEPVPEPTPAPAANNADFDFVDNDIMAEFERAVAEQKAVTEAAKQAKSDAKKDAMAKKESLPITPEEVMPASTPLEVLDPTANIDFNPPVAEKISTPAAEVPVVDIENKIPENDINIDKMLNEAQGLSASENSEDVPNAIDSTLDTDKLLKEASGMGNIDTEALNEFDDFIKKEGA
jgi:hypothetical protein